MASGTAPDGLAALAAAVGAVDVLVFRRVANDRYAHVGGLGMGAGWAGIVELDAAAEPVLAQAIAAGAPVRAHGGEPAHVVGPYYACTATLCPVDADTLVVWGSPHPAPDLAGRPADELTAASARADGIVAAASPAKMLADELEVLHAVQAVTAAQQLELSEAMGRFADVAAESLSCEVAAVITGSGRTHVHAPAAAGGMGRDLVRTALLGAFADVTVPVCVQDSSQDPLGDPLSPAQGVVSYLVVPLDPSVGGLLFAAHTRDNARGFTLLCQRMAQQLAESGSIVLQVARMRAQLQNQLNASTSQARQDQLTGVGNRLRWEEGLDNAQDRLQAGRSYTVVSLDLDELKETNDTHGHCAGDRLLVALADTLRHTLRDGDLVCRLGGDEFGVLLGHRGGQQPAGVLDRLHEELGRTRSADGLPLRVSLGAAVAEPGGRISDAFHEADTAMYQNKRARSRLDAIGMSTDAG